MSDDSSSTSLFIVRDDLRSSTHSNARERHRAIVFLLERISSRGSRTGDGSQSIGVRDTIGHSVRTRSRPPRAVDRIPAHAENNMSALLASSFVGRVAAFKATKVQVRFFRGTSRRERRANGATRARRIVARGNERAEMCASVAGDRRTKSIGASRRARERERGDRRGRWVRGKRYARAFTARTRRGAAWTRARGARARAVVKICSPAREGWRSFSGLRLGGGVC